MDLGVTEAVSLKVYEKGKLAPNWDIQSDLSGNITVQDLMKYSQQVIISVAKSALSEEQARGFDKEPTVKVDNKFGKREEQVLPFGQIEYIARQNVKEIFLYAYTMILQQTKVVTGHYMESNVVFFNGVEVARKYSDLEKFLNSQKSFKEADKIEFVNIAPYATRLELEGISKGRAKKPFNFSGAGKGKEGPKRMMGRKPNGTYTLATQAIRRKYRNNSFIKYQVVPGGYLGLTAPERGSGTGRIFQRGKYKGSPYVYPSILIYVKAAGVLNE